MLPRWLQKTATLGRLQQNLVSNTSAGSVLTSSYWYMRRAHSSSFKDVCTQSQVDVSWYSPVYAAQCHSDWGRSAKTQRGTSLYRGGA